MAAILFADRVKDSSTTTGTGNFTLSGTAPTGYQSFNTAFSTSTNFYYCIELGAEWEVGQGHLSASTTLVRDTILASTNANAAVSFSAGTKNVFCTIPAYHARNLPLQRVEVTGTTQAALVNTIYIANNGSLVTVTLPSTAAVGDIVGVVGLGAGGWSIAQNASQEVKWTSGGVDGVNETTAGTGGSLASSDIYDSIEVICLATNNTWGVQSVKGNITLV